MTNKIYTGIGSRQAPGDIIFVMNGIGYALAKKGYTLRSGGADGSDAAFETGCDSGGGNKEIYLPWKNFNNNQSFLYNVSTKALELAETIHPAWGVCSYGAKKLHGRNCYQVLGLDLNTPSNFLICWTMDGQEKGGTRTAIVLAKRHKIPVYNLAIKKDFDEVMKNIVL